MNDLILHLLCGSLITSVILLLGKPVAGRRPDLLIIVAVAAPLFVGAIKEAGDLWLGWGTPEVADLAFTWAGGIAALMAIAMVDWIIYIIREKQRKK